MNTTRDALLHAARAAQLAGNADLVIDCRRATSRISLLEMTSLVYMMMEHRDLFGRKVAFLAPEDKPLDQLKFMEDFAVNRGLQVGAFRDYEAAVNWLMPSTPVAITAEN